MRPFYAALFEVYGAQMLSARTEQLFGDDANAARDVLLANYEKYLKGNEVFQVNVEQTEAVETTEKEKQVFPLHGLVALFLFLIIYVEYGRRFDAGSGKPYLALPAPLGEGFQMMGLLAAGNRSGGGWLGVTALFRGEPRTPSGDQRHDIIAGSLYRVDMDCWKMDTKSDRFYIQHLPAGIDQSVVLPGFRGYCSLHSGIKNSCGTSARWESIWNLFHCKFMERLTIA